MSTLFLAGLGELLWDVFGKKEKLGGAPANFAYHVNNLGAESIAISTVGNDIRGTKALEELSQAGLSTMGIAIDPQHPTGYVEAHINAEGVAEYFFPDNVAWDHLKITPAAETILHKLNAISFGSLAQRQEKSRQTIYDVLEKVPSNCLKIFDINLRQHFYSPDIIKPSLQYADILKLNEEELPILAKMLSLKGDTQEQLQHLQEKFKLKLTILTQGQHGSILLTEDGIDIHPGITTSVVDTVGAGDAFTAAAVLGFLQGQPLQQINDHANKIAAFVCQHRGAMVAVPKNLRLFA